MTSSISACVTAVAAMLAVALAFALPLTPGTFYQYPESTPPTSYRGTIYAPTSDNGKSTILAIDPQTGRIRWSWPLGSWAPHSIVGSGDALYLETTSALLKLQLPP